MLAILKRELRSYFSTPLGYIFLGVFLLLSGFFFSFGNLFSQSSYYSGFLGNMLFIFMFISPILTMRLLTDEKRNKTDQLLLTSPVGLSSIVLGKYLSAVTIFVIGMLVTVSYTIVISVFGDLQIPEVMSGYIGFLLIGSSFISIGLFVSATTENQVISAVVTLAAILLIWLLDVIQQSIPNTEMTGIIFSVLIAGAFVFLVFMATRNIPVVILTAVVGALIILAILFLKKELFTGLVARVLNWFSLLKRNQSFAIGVLKLEDIVYYLSFISAFLFLTVRLIEKRRWS